VAGFTPTTVERCPIANTVSHVFIRVNKKGDTVSHVAHSLR